MRILVAGLIVFLLAAEPAPPPSLLPEAVPPPATPADGATEAPEPCLLPFAPPPPGWFGAFEVGALFPRLQGQRAAPPGLLTGPVPGFNAGGIDSVGAGRFSIGYRPDGGWPEVAFAARFAGGDHRLLLVQGDPAVVELLRQNSDTDVSVRPAPPGSTGSTSFTTRFDLSAFDFGFGRHEEFLGPLWDVRWQAGVRAASLFSDDRRLVTDGWSQASNHFAGVGPVAQLGLSHALSEPAPGVNVSLFAGAGGGVLFGQSQMTFREDLAGVAREARQARDQSVPMMELEAGVSLWRGQKPGARLSFGYRYEHWWGAGGPGIDLSMQGVFFRLERNF